ncbi:MAG TPA: hypothetical protein VK699_14910 [Terriglobales bacterium]|jgi:hypothetical protein|nr:hypothetical protein [Terriglobales bacterium]
MMTRVSKVLVKNRMFLVSLAVLCMVNQRLSASTVTYQDTAGNQRIYVAATGTNNHLLVDRWDGFHWQWYDQGLPAGTTAVYYPAAITYPDLTGDQRIYIFAIGSNKHLVANYRTNGNWHWADYGAAPFGFALHDRIAAVSYPDSAGNQQIFVFTTATNDHLTILSGNGTSFHWIDGGKNPGPGLLLNPTAITYLDTAGVQHTCAYLDGNDLIEACRNPNGTWTLTDRGVPSGIPEIAIPSAFSFQDDVGAQEIGIFCMGSNGHLVLDSFDGSSVWSWSDQYFTGGAGVRGAAWPAAVTYLDPIDAFQKIYAFVEGGSFGHLVVNYWDGFSWQWADQGLGPNGVADGPKDAITYLDATGHQRIYVFVVGTNHHLLVNYWDGFGWHWADLGNQLSGLH